jgi:hypothetical protein
MFGKLYVAPETEPLKLYWTFVAPVGPVSIRMYGEPEVVEAFQMMPALLFVLPVFDWEVTRAINVPLPADGWYT